MLAQGAVRGAVGGVAAALLVALALVPAGTAAPTEGTPFSFGAAGDFGFGPGAQATFAAAGSSALDFLLVLGDTTYGEANESTWCAAVRAQVPHTIVQAGNHDTGENRGAGLPALLAACPYDLPVPMTGQYGHEWLFDYPARQPLVRFILTSCGTAFPVENTTQWACAPGDAHFAFVAHAIDAGRAAGIPWTVVATHKNCITEATKSCEIGTDFFKMLVDRKVDLVLQGHDHVYQRSKQLRCALPGAPAPACVVDDGADGRYTKGEGTVVMTQGTGGAGGYPINASDAEAGYFAAAFTGAVGFVKYTVGASSMQVEFVRAAGADAHDSFVIERAQPPSETGAGEAAAVAAVIVIGAVMSPILARPFRRGRG